MSSMSSGSSLSASALILRADAFNTAVTANTNILSIDLSPKQTPLAFFTIYTCFVGSGTFSVMRTKSGTTVTEQMNAGTALVANASYIFTLPVRDIESINIQYSAGTTMSKLVIVEELSGTA